MPFRKERIELLYKQGMLDAEIQALIREGARDRQRQDNLSPEEAEKASARLCSMKSTLRWTSHTGGRTTTSSTG